MMKIFHLLKSGAGTTRTTLAILRQLSIQKKFLRQHIQPILDKALQKNDGSLEMGDIDKINHYYGLAVPAILGEAFCRLHGKHMNETERWAATCQGAMTGLFDDFFDKQYLSDEAVKALLVSNHHASHIKSNEKLFNLFYSKVLQCSPGPEQVRQTLTEVYEAQVLSKKQTSQILTEAEITAITLLKGGTSLLFYRSVFLPAITDKEKKLHYELGGIMQLCNDIFDVYKDREANIQTLITTATHILPVRKLFLEKLAVCFESAQQQGLIKKNVLQFLSLLSLGIFSRALVCLDQLRENETFTGHQFKVNAYSRKQLICDMDTGRNKLISARYHMQLMTLAGKYA